jgi:hypothetical protein
MIFIGNTQIKSAPARQKSGPGSMACGLKHFFVLIFWLLFHQGKNDWHRPAKRATMSINYYKSLSLPLHLPHF